MIVALSFSWLACDGVATPSPLATTDGAITEDGGGWVDAHDAKRSRDGSSARDAEPPNPDATAGDRIPMFVAQGSIGRSTISCDDGRTWVANRSFDREGDPLVCGMVGPATCGEGPCSYLRQGECRVHETCDCSHHPGAAKGVAYGDGWFVATWGWGHSGSVRRSRDGVHWEETLSEEDGAWVAFGGVAFGNRRFVLSRRTPFFSPDGAAWVEGAEADFRSPSGEIVQSVRDFHYVGGTPGLFVASASPPEAVLVSGDGGAWRPPASIAAGCLQDVGAGGGIGTTDTRTTAAVGGDGRLCTSEDGGDTWTRHPHGIGADSVSSRAVIWDGSELRVWGTGADGNARLYRSADGVHWTDDPLDPPRIRIGPVARSEETGTYVTTGHIWHGYDQQRFYRSEDGVNWEPLADGAFEASHTIFELVFGYGETSDACPGSP
jgi:hypothetical protein